MNSEDKVFLDSINKGEILEEKFMTTEKIYKVVWLPKAAKQLLKIKNEKITNEIKDKVKNQLVKDPWGKGERMEGNWVGYWKYRIRDYRVIYKIFENEVLIEIFRIGDRKEIY